jgi:uncharacterized protein
MKSIIFVFVLYSFTIVNCKKQPGGYYNSYNHRNQKTYENEQNDENQENQTSTTSRPLTTNRITRVRVSEKEKDLGIKYYKQAFKLYKSKEKLPTLILFKKACTYKHGEACKKVGDIYYQGAVDIKIDLKKAEYYYKWSCSYNSYMGCYKTGNVKEDKETSFSSQIALKYYAKSCLLNYGPGCNKAGFYYVYGIGVKKSAVIGFKYWLKACKSGTGLACKNIGFYYIKIKMYKRAKYYLNKSCNLSCGSGCTGMALLHFGLGMKKNLKRVVYLFKKGCDLKDKYGCFQLSEIYEKEELAEQNLELSIKYLKKACKYGMEEACLNSEEME